MNGNSKALPVGLLLLCLIPLFIFTLLGSHTRLMWDDFCANAFARDLGPLQSILHFRTTHSGSYTDYLVHGMAVPLGIYGAAVNTLVTLGLWLIALAWLVSIMLTHLAIARFRLLLATAIASLALAATINALPSLQSFYWFSASIRYTFPLALLTLILAATISAPKQYSNRPRFAAIVIGAAAFSFLNAGFSEMYAVFQLTFFTLLLLAIFVIYYRPDRRPYLVVFGTTWLATFASVFIQLTSTGASNRTSRFVESYGMLGREVDLLLSKTFEASFHFITDVKAFTGFTILTAATLCLMLAFARSPAPLSQPRQFKLGRNPLLFGLIVQLLCLPLLWMHISDSPQLLGRFSYGYVSVIVINALLIVSLLVLLRLRSDLIAFLATRQIGDLIIPAVTLSLVLFLFALTQIRSIHWRAAAYLLITSHSMLVVQLWHLSCSFSVSTARALTSLISASYVLTYLSIAAVIFANIFVSGVVFVRTMAFAPYLLAMQGISWGICLGYALNSHLVAAVSGARLLKLIQRGTFATASVIALGIALGQAQKLPSLQLYAREWDTRHEAIIRAHDAGARTLSVPPLSFSLEKSIGAARMEQTDCAELFYDLEAIEVDDS